MDEPDAHRPEPGPSSEPGRKRPPPGQRRLQILQTLAQMLESPEGERVTTAALAARLSVSEAALYRHFASKAQMFEGLIDFIEHTLLGLVQQIQSREPDPRQQWAHMLTVVLQFGEKNPGMARVMVGDALVLEHGRLQQRINLLLDKLEAQLRQTWRGPDAAPTHGQDVAAAAAVSMAFVVGRLQRYTRSGFRQKPTEQLDACLRHLLLNL